MAIKFTADSTCDLSPALLQKYQISMIPLYVLMNDKPLRDGVDVTPDDMYAYTARTGKLCTTAAINVADYVAFFAPFSKEYDTVIHVCISSEFSSCFQNATLAAQHYPNVHVVDSRNLSTGHGHVVLAGAEMAARGMQPGEITQAMTALTARVNASFIPDCLDYLRKGGRCSAVAALGANLLKLKPCIQVRDGKMGVGKKYRGTFDKVIVEYTQELLAAPETIDSHRVFITHSGISREIIDLVRETIAGCMEFDEVLVTRAGGTISGHCGPGTLGVLFIEK